MRFAVDEEVRREISGAFHLEYVGFALGGFGLARVTERKRVRTERGGKHAERQPREILFHRDGWIRRWPWRSFGTLGTSSATRRCRRRRCTGTGWRSSAARP